jgi:glycosyltransferase involved in cell wall biosynthesis
MLISILVPIYKVEKFISKCLDSIFNQTYSDIEYVFLDDCSPDNSVRILKKNIKEHNIDQSKITIISHSENKGIAITRNDLLDHAKGEYVLFIDSDDWIESDMVEQMVSATNKGAIDIVGCDYTDEFIDGKSKLRYENYAQDCNENIVRLINYNIGPTLWKILVKKELFKNVKFRPDIEIGEDYIASIMLYYYAKNCSNVHQYLYHYVQYNTYRYSNQIRKSISNHINAIIIIEEFLKSKGLYDSRINKEIKLRKFSIKRYYLVPPLMDYAKWKITFPETDGMWRYIKYSRKEKIIYWLAEKHIFFLLHLFNQINILRSIKIVIKTLVQI